MQHQIQVTFLGVQQNSLIARTATATLTCSVALRNSHAAYTITVYHANPPEWLLYVTGSVAVVVVISNNSLSYGITLVHAPLPRFD